MNRRAISYLFLMLLVPVCAGANCQRLMWRPAVELPPAVLAPEPTLDQIIGVINNNRSRVTTVSAPSAVIGAAGMPSIRAKLDIGGPRHMRLTAESFATGSELDVGSNHELFWIWVKRNQPPGVYFARHDSFANSPIQQSIPIRPEWLVEAVGLVYLDPTLPHQGPFRRADGRLEIHTAIASGQGPMTRVLVVDERSGWVLQQNLYDSRRQLVASAVNSRHMQDPITGFIMPRKTELSWPAAGTTMTLELKSVVFNSLELSPSLWIKPSFPGYPDRDLTQMTATSGQAKAPRMGLGGLLPTSPRAHR